MSCGPNYSTCQVNATGSPYLASLVVMSLLSQVDTAICHCIFSSVSSSDNYDPAFGILKGDTETLPLNFSSHVAKAYNLPFSMDELLTELECYCNTFHGPRGIHNQISLTFHPQAFSFCCQCTTVWTESSVPAAWREATVIHTLTPSKYHFLSASHRPISQTSCMCKTMQCILNHHFVWTLEDRSLL
jgi:hypothetical protein